MWYKVKKIYQWSNLVRPKWKPWPNTIAYYPLEKNFNDYSWNWYNLTVSNATITNLNWVSCGLYSNGRAYNATPTVWSTRTLVAWFYNQTSWILVWTGATQSWYYAIMMSNNWDKIQISDFYTTGYSSSSISSNSWHLWVAIADWANMYIYVDWVLANSWTHSNTLSSTWVSAWGKPFTNQYTDYFSWYLSNVILENKARTAQEISNYYNQTKSKYWL